MPPPLGSTNFPRHKERLDMLQQDRVRLGLIPKAANLLNGPAHGHKSVRQILQILNSNKRQQRTLKIRILPTHPHPQTRHNKGHKPIQQMYLSP